MPNVPEIRFFNSLGRELQAFTPIERGSVGIYTCGPTVYATAHIGNLRTFLFEDILCRSLEYFDLEVRQIMNLTDVEDKIIAGAMAKGVSIDDFVAPHIESFFRDLERLHIRKAEEYPRATHHFAEMIEIIEALMAKSYAYEAEGCVFFRIEKDEDYGRLSGVDLSQQRPGARVADDEYGKEDARDFVLWKGAKDGEPSWPSPWGDGRPGWHIECSAMSMKYLGPTFDIHCGGVDNCFPHHENEIAQSESATGKTFSRYWLHSEHLVVDGQKMSKSLGNQYTLDDLLARDLPLRAVRYVLLATHYREKVNFTFASVKRAAKALGRVDELRFRLANSCPGPTSHRLIETAAQDLLDQFGAALADDLNLSEALAAVYTFVRTVNKAIEADGVGPGDKERAAEALLGVDQVLGVLHDEDWVTASGAGAEEELSDQEIEDLIAKRTAARREKNYGEADRVRDLLKEAGVAIEDLRDRVRWKRI